MIKGLTIAASGMRAQTARLNATASNTANVATTQSADGSPYQAVAVELAASGPGANGVEVVGSHRSGSPGHVTHDPRHPHADAAGKVTHSNVSLVEEMTDLVTTQRGFEANVQSFQALNELARQALEIGGREDRS